MEPGARRLPCPAVGCLARVRSDVVVRVCTREGVPFLRVVSWLGTLQCNAVVSTCLPQSEEEEWVRAGSWCDHRNWYALHLCKGFGVDATTRGESEDAATWHGERL